MVLEEAGRPLVQKEVPIPEPGPGRSWCASMRAAYAAPTFT